MSAHKEGLLNSYREWKAMLDQIGEEAMEDLLKNADILGVEKLFGKLSMK